MRESPIEPSRVDLSVGDSVRIDDQILTVLEISEDEVTFRVDAVDEFELEELELGNPEMDHLESGSVVCQGDQSRRLPPR